MGASRGRLPRQPAAAARSSKEQAAKSQQRMRGGGPADLEVHVDACRAVPPQCGLQAVVACRGRRGEGRGWQASARLQPTRQASDEQHAPGRGKHGQVAP
jgi:hypothetical protein